MIEKRRIPVTNKIFAMADLLRLATILEDRNANANELVGWTTLKFSIGFSNGTILEANRSELFREENLAIGARATNIEMIYSNLKTGESIRVSLDSDRTFASNEVYVSSTERTFVNDCYIRMQQSLDATPNQDFWIAKHRSAVLNIVALGTGTMMVGGINWIARHFLGDLPIKPLASDSPWRDVILRLSTLFYIFGWVWRWAMGFLWGAVPIHRWIMSAWPKIELSIGPNHVRPEVARRKLIIGVIILLVLPIIANLATDLIKRLN